MAPTPQQARTPLARLLALVLAALVGAAGVLGLAGSPASASPVTDEARLYELTNASRAAHGLAPLAYDPAATAVARNWAAELARSTQLRHNPDVVRHVDAHVTRQWVRLAENVGYSPAVDAVHDAYMNSPGHRANILGDYNRVGVGAAHDAQGRLWTTVVFLKGPALPVAAPVANGTVDAGSVERLYAAYFRRDADAAGRDYWVGRLLTGTSLGQISAAFATSPEFVGTYGHLDDAGFVQLVYRNVLGRDADAAGSGYWVGQLAARRLDRGGVMVNFSESPEFKAATANR